ncbi:MAG TPA: superoxide dismutase family protein [Sphingomicrobium sp.]|nr:superoxide dismutase family protein [Sphingomicrobium sp.]
MRPRVLIAAALLPLPGCGDPPPRQAGSAAADALFREPFTRPMVDSSGARIGTVTGTPGEEGVIIAVSLKGLDAGDHGMHLHETGVCDRPDFATSGGHWNASRRAHGHDNPNGPHDGDWGNLTAAADGTASSDRLIPRWHATIPASGLSLLIHARKDDESTDPDGNSGARIACGVVLPVAEDG